MINPSILLADSSAILRQLVLKEIFNYKDDNPEVLELESLKAEDPLVIPYLESQEKDGSWSDKAGFKNSKSGKFYYTCCVLKRLGFLGYTVNAPVIREGVAFLLSRQNKEGAWPLTRYNDDETEGYTMIPLQTAIPLNALLSCGLVDDPHIDAAFRWLLEQKLSDGTWPTGKAGGVLAKVGGYRRMPHSDWGCRTNSTEVLHCFALHPVWRKSEEAYRLLDLLLCRETRDRNALGFQIARLIGIEPTTGYFTYHARFDPGFLLELCWRLGTGVQEERIQALIAFIQQERGVYGLWEYKSNPLANRWMTFYLLRSLIKLSEDGEWHSAVPRIHFQAYPRKNKRY